MKLHVKIATMAGAVALSAGGLLIGAGSAQAIPCGIGKITVTGGALYYTAPCDDDSFIHLQLEDTKADGKCAHAHVYGNGFADTKRTVCGNGKKLAFNLERQSIGFGPPHVTLSVS